MTQRVSWRRVIDLFVPYKAKLICLTSAIVAASLATMVFPFLLRRLLDTAIPSGNRGDVSFTVIGMMVVVVAQNTLGVTQAILAASVGQRVMHDLRGRLFRRLQEFSLSFYTKTSTGEIQSRVINDINGLQGTVTSTASVLAASSATLVGGTVGMALLNWRLTAATFAVSPLFVYTSRRVGNTRRTFTKDRQAKMAEMSAYTGETLNVSGFILGRSLAQADHFSATFARQSNSLMDLVLKSALSGRWRTWAVQIVVGAIPVFIYWVAGMGWAPEVSIGTLIAFTALQQAMFSPAASLMQVSIGLSSDLGIFARIFEYLDMDIEIEDTGTEELSRCGATLAFRNVTFGYGDGPAVVDRVSFRVEPGQKVALVGATGSGKTTIGYLAARFYEVASGSVEIGGTDIRNATRASLASIVGIVPQEPYLFHASIAENLRLAAPSATDEDLREACTDAQLHSLIESLPAGYDTLVGDRGFRFSGGERQRLCIARAMLRDTPILILDEATSALDTQTESAVQIALNKLAAGRTTLCIAHRLSTVEDADVILAIENGRIVERGRHEELIETTGLYARMAREGMFARRASEVASG